MVERLIIPSVVSVAIVNAINLCAFAVSLLFSPCTSGSYIVIFGLLVSDTAHFVGLLYLLLYTAIFVSNLKNEASYKYIWGREIW